MSTLHTNNIWGAAETPDSSDAQRLRALPSIKRQLRTFLSEQLEAFRPDRLIVIERKGTAILRALMEWDLEPLPWSWSRVLSSETVDEVPDEYFAGKRILIFDDMMRTGRHLTDVLEHLQQRGVWNLSAGNVRVAVFAVHEQSSNGRVFREHSLPSSWFYRDLSTAAYREIRTQIVRMLQRSGSLMLDTEHIEVRVRFRDNIIRFLDLLRRRAEAVLFHSSGDRTNITVFYPQDDAHKLPIEAFPPGTLYEGIVKKCRIVQRQGDEFAILPICYPSVPMKDGTWLLAENDKRLFSQQKLSDGLGRFYGAGLVGALNVLHWTLRDLAAGDPQTYSISLPLGPGDTDARGGYTLEHLQSMYPSIDLSSLTQRIAEIEGAARKEGTLLRRRKPASTDPTRFTDQELRDNAIELLQAIRHLLDQKIVTSLKSNDESPTHPSGLTASEIFQVGREIFGWADIRTSVLFDILIDEANIVPHVETRRAIGDARSRFLVRTYEPDGEMISELVHRLTAQWGLPQGL